MNINAVSLAAPRFQSAKPARNMNFTGLEKAAQSAGSAVGEAAGRTGISKFLLSAFGMVKKLGGKFLKGISKIVDNIANFAKTQAKVPKKNGFVFQNGKLNGNKGVINDKTNNKNISTICVKNGNIVINGKTYKYDGELPDDIIISQDKFSVRGKNSISELNNKIKEFAKIVEENGKLIEAE